MSRKKASYVAQVANRKGDGNMVIGILRKGDRVISVNADFIAVERASKEVDLVPIERSEMGFRVVAEKIVTIGFGDNVVSEVTESGATMINF